MGVTLVLSYPIPESKSSQQVLESLYKLMDILNAKRCGTYKLDCETFMSIPQIQPTKMLQTFHDTEKPETTFALIDSGVHYLLADAANFDIIVQKYLNNLFLSKRPLRIECKGNRFELGDGDFVIRIGQVQHDVSGFLKGITIEIEYTPCSIPAYCWDILSQVAHNFVPQNQIPSQPICDIFKPIDTIRQYQQTFNSMRKQI